MIGAFIHSSVKAVRKPCVFDLNDVETTGVATYRKIVRTAGVLTYSVWGSVADVRVPKRGRCGEDVPKVGLHKYPDIKTSCEATSDETCHSCEGRNPEAEAI